MAKIARAKQEIFGSTGATSEFGVFGSDSEGAAATTKDPALIQSLASYLRGLYASTANATEPPRIQDMNALYYLFARQIAYGMQAGVPEWLATENYYANSSVVLGSNGKIYISKTGTDGSPNVGNDPVTDTGTNWRFVWTNDVFSAFPLSDLSRVLALNGDGIPMFPDNVAGRTYVPNFATTDGWSSTNGTTTVSGNILKSTVTADGLILRKGINFGTKLSRFRIRLSKTAALTAFTNTGGFIILKQKSFIANVWDYFDFYNPQTTSSEIAFTIDGVDIAGDTIEISQEGTYIGSGAYDTKAYGKDGQTVFDNVGVLPVPGPRGMAMSCLGKGSLVGSSPIIGQTGHVAFKFKRGTIGTEQYIFDNADGTTSGCNIRFNATNAIRVVVNNGNGYGYGTQVITDTVSWHSAVINFEATTMKFFIDAVLAETISSPQIMVIATKALSVFRNQSGIQNYNGLLTAIDINSNIWTQDDVTRYHNGDDAVDSQQKAINQVPHAIKICDAKGNIRQPGLPVYADNTAALTGGLVAGEQYRTSIGVLMVVY